MTSQSQTPRNAAGVPWQAVGALGLGLFGMGAAIGSYSGYVPLLLERGVSAERAGFGMTLFLLFLFLSVLPADWSTRYLPIRTVLLVGLAVGGVGALLTGIPTLSTALLSRTLLGIGQATVFVTSMKYAGLRTPPAQTARVQGMLGGLFILGFAIAIAATPWLLAVFGAAIPAITAVFVLAGGLWALTLPRTGYAPTPSLGEYLAVFTSRTGLALGLANMATFGFLIVATTWYTDLMGRYPVLPITGVLTGFALLTVVGRIAGGWIERALGYRATISFSLLGLAGTLGVMVLAIAIESPWLLTLAIFGTGLGFGIPFGPLFAFAFTELTAEPGTVLVGMMLLGNGGALIYPWLVGQILVSTTSYVGGFAIMTVTVVAIWGFWQVAVGT